MSGRGAGHNDSGGSRAPHRGTSPGGRGSRTTVHPGVPYARQDSVGPTASTISTALPKSAMGMLARTETRD